MKKIILTLCAALFSFAVFAADNNLPAIMMQPSGGLFEDKGEMMEWTKSLDSGTEIKVITVADDKGQQVPETKKSQRKVEKKTVNCTMYHVIYENQKFWVLNDRVSIDEKIAVVKAPAAVYRSPDIADVKDVSLPIGSMITIGKKFTANNKFEMYKVSYYDAANYEVVSGYVLTKKVSTDDKDMKACRLIEKLKGTKDEAIQEELYNNIKKLNISSEISAYAEEVKESLREPSLLEAGIQDMWYLAVVVNGDTSSKVNVRSTPGTDSDVVGAFTAESTQVYVIGRTVATDTIGSSTNCWYHVTDDENGIDGWVFGDYVVILEE